MPDPYLSLCVICGDADQERLPRLLDSVLRRKHGPSADEVVIWWNGTGDAPASLAEYAVAGVDIRIVRGEWREDFGWARQRSFEAARGVWRMYLDADDVLAGPEDPAVAASPSIAEGQDGAASETHASLMDFLRDLPPDRNAVWFPYDYVTDGQTAVPIQRLWRCRIVRWADGWAWRYPVHEDMFPVGSCRPGPVFNSGVVVIHKPDTDFMSKSRRNLRILMRVYEDHPETTDFRLFYGIGAGLHDQSRFAEAIEWYIRAIHAGADDENKHIYFQLVASAYAQLGKMEEAEAAALKAVSILPDRPSGHLAVGEILLAQRFIVRARAWLERGLALPQPPVYMMDHPAVRTGFYKAGLADCYLNMGEYDKAVATAEAAVKASSHPYPATVLRVAKDAQIRHRSFESWSFCVRHALDNGDVHAAARMAEMTPVEIEGSAPVRVLQAEVAAANAVPTLTDPQFDTHPHEAIAAVLARSNGLPVTVVVPDCGRAGTETVPGAPRRWNAHRLLRVLDQHGRVVELAGIAGPPPEDPRPLIQATFVPGPRPTRSVAIYCPHFVEPWGPYTGEERGIGGSEEAVIYLSEVLAEAGEQVDVYAPIPGNLLPLHVHKGVCWRPIASLSPDIPADHLIALRAPWMANFRGMRERKGALWAWHHDHAYPPESWSKDVAAVGHHLFVSRWQRSVLEAQVDHATSGAVIYNGIPTDQIRAGRNKLLWKNRDPFRCVWASMPTRRLDRILAIWPQIKKRWPKATLDIFYGMQTAAQLWRFSDPKLMEQVLTTRRQAGSMGDLGVQWRGRLGHSALTEEFWTAGAMLYPSDFPETYMIAATRAAACGVIPVVTATGALPETSPLPPVPGPIDDEGFEAVTLEGFLEAVGRAFEATHTEREDLSDRMIRQRGWRGVALRLIAAMDSVDAGRPLPDQPPPPSLVIPPPVPEITILV